VEKSLIEARLWVGIEALKQLLERFVLF